MCNIRNCFICGKEIKECMGFVLARDIINESRPPRELCEKYVWEIADSNFKDFNP